MLWWILLPVLLVVVIPMARVLYLAVRGVPTLRPVIEHVMTANLDDPDEQRQGARHRRAHRRVMSRLRWDWFPKEAECHTFAGFLAGAYIGWRGTWKQPSMKHFCEKAIPSLTADIEPTTARPLDS